MNAINFEKLNCATDLYHAHRAEVQITGKKCLLEMALKNTEVVLLCAAYDSFWNTFLDVLDPDAAGQAVEILKEGQSPVLVLAILQNAFLTHLSETQVDIKPPDQSPEEGKLWLLILHQGGHLWHQHTVIKPS